MTHFLDTCTPAHSSNTLWYSHVHKFRRYEWRNVLIWPKGRKWHFGRSGISKLYKSHYGENYAESSVITITDGIFTFTRYLHMTRRVYILFPEWVCKVMHFLHNTHCVIDYLKCNLYVYNLFDTRLTLY